MVSSPYAHPIVALDGGGILFECNDVPRAMLAHAAPDMARALLANGYVRSSDGLWHTDCCNEQNDGGASCFESCTQARSALAKAGVLNV